MRIALHLWNLRAARWNTTTTEDARRLTAPTILVLAALASTLVPLTSRAGYDPFREARRADGINLVVTERRGASEDTCRADWNLPNYVLWEFAQRRCEATRCELTTPRTVTGIGVVWFNYDPVPREKGVRLFVAEDAGGLPGAELWSLTTTTTELAASATELVTYAIDPPIAPTSSSLWFGHEELTAGAPSSLFDESPDAPNASSPHPCGAWEEQILADYLQCLIFEPGSSDVDPVEPRQALRIERLVNPIESALRFELWSREASRARIDLLHADGRSARSLGEVTISGGGPATLRYSLDGMASGVYFLRVRDSRQSIARKLLVVR